MDRAGVRRLVVLSSASVYNQNVSPGTTEASPLPKTLATSYNAAKIAGDDAIRALCELNAKLGRVVRHGGAPNVRGDGESSISSALTVDLRMISRAMLIGSLNLRGPALPGFTKRIPSRRSIEGRCE